MTIYDEFNSKIIEKINYFRLINVVTTRINMKNNGIDSIRELAI